MPELPFYSPSIRHVYPAVVVQALENEAAARAQWKAAKTYTPPTSNHGARVAGVQAGRRKDDAGSSIEQAKRYLREAREGKSS